MDAGKQLNMRDAGRGAEADRRARHLPAAELLGALPVEFEDPGVGGWASASLEPVEQLRGRVHMIAVLAVGETVSPCRCEASHGALSGTRTQPFSIIAVCACIRRTLSDCGWYRVTA